jgi:hypothetical protein
LIPCQSMLLFLPCTPLRNSFKFSLFNHYFNTSAASLFWFTSGTLIKLIVKLPKTPIQYLHYEKIGWFTIGFAIEFLSCNDHMQLIVFLCHDCYEMNFIICTGCNSLYVQPYMYATHAILLQLHKNNLCNCNATTM